MSKKEKKQLDKLEAIAIERAEQRVVEGTYLKFSFLNPLTVLAMHTT